MNSLQLYEENKNTVTRGFQRHQIAQTQKLFYEICDKIVDEYRNDQTSPFVREMILKMENSKKTGTSLTNFEIAILGEAYQIFTKRRKIELSDNVPFSYGARWSDKNLHTPHSYKDKLPLFAIFNFESPKGDSDDKERSQRLAREIIDQARKQADCEANQIIEQAECEANQIIEQANQIIEQAKCEAKKIIDQVREQAECTRRAAHEDAQLIRAHAKDEAAHIHRYAEDEAAHIIDQAHRHAEDEAAHIIDQANRHSQELIDNTRCDAKQESECIIKDANECSKCIIEEARIRAAEEARERTKKAEQEASAIVREARASAKHIINQAQTTTSELIKNTIAEQRSDAREIVSDVISDELLKYNDNCFAMTPDLMKPFENNTEALKAMEEASSQCQSQIVQLLNQSIADWEDKICKTMEAWRFALYPRKEKICIDTYLSNYPFLTKTADELIQSIMEAIYNPTEENRIDETLGNYMVNKLNKLNTQIQVFLRQFEETIKVLGFDVIKPAAGEKYDPRYHRAPDETSHSVCTKYVGCEIAYLQTPGIKQNTLYGEEVLAYADVVIADTPENREIIAKNTRK